MRHSLLPLLILLAAPGAAQPRWTTIAVTEQAIPGSRVRLDEVLFLPGRDGRLAVARGGLWRICRSGDHARGSQLGLLSIVLAKERLLYLGEGEACEVRITQANSPPGAPDLVHDAFGCRMVFTADGGVLQAVRIRPTPFDAGAYERCMYRLGLFLTGYQGALAIPDDRLFVPPSRSPWMSFGRLPRALPVFQYLIGACDVAPARISRRAELPRTMRCRDI